MPPSNRAGRISKLIFLGCAFAQLFLCACQRRSQIGFAPGNQAPPFTLEALNGGRRALSDYRGKVVLLNFFASWCAPCVEEAPALERLHLSLKNSGFTILGVASGDEREKVVQFRDRLGLSFPILLDDGSLAQDVYKTTGFPESFLLSPEGSMLMINDPADGSPSVRLIGPRKWDSAEMKAQLAAILRNLLG